MKNITFNQLQLRLLAILFFLFTSAVFGYRYFIELPKLEQSVAKLSEREFDTLRFIISSQLDELARINFDYAVWTSTYDFMASQNEAYIQENMIANTFKSLEIDGIFYVDAQLNPILAKGVHHRKLTEMNFSFYDFEQYPQNVSLLPTTTTEAKVAKRVGFINTQHGPAMYSATQIRKSDLSGENRGFLIMIKLLETKFVDELSRYTLANIEYLPMPAESELASMMNWDTKITYTAVDRYCDVVLRDNSGEAVSVLRMEHSVGSIPALINAQSCIFVVLMSLFIYLVNRLVSITIISPVKLLASEIKKRGNSNNYAPLDEKHTVSELAIVSKNMNQLMLTVQQQNEILVQQTITDQLTQILNRRGLGIELERHKDLCIRKQIGFIVVMIDIDHFKKYNDSEGHVEGDITLQEVANILKNQCKRVGDVCARYGGEEFTLLFSDMDADNLSKKLAGIIAAMAKSALPHPCSPTADHVTISMGALMVQADDVVDYKLPGDELFSLADSALYEAKESGRNRFVIKSLADEIKEDNQAGV